MQRHKEKSLIRENIFVYMKIPKRHKTDLIKWENLAKRLDIRSICIIKFMSIH